MSAEKIENEEKEMTKKILYVAALLFALACILVSCGHEHAFGEWVVVSEATCTSEGVEERVCECGEKETQAIPVEEHTEGEWITKLLPTCTEKGRKELMCSECGEMVMWDDIAEEGHTLGEWLTDIPATCTTDGTKHQICKICEETIKTGTIKAKGHTESDWIIDTAATCTLEGGKHTECTVCNVTLKTEVITKKEHNNTVSVVSKATAESKAVIKYSCISCANTYTEEVEPINVVVTAGGVGMTITDNVYYTKSFTVTASGGYGKYKYKYQCGNFIQDFTERSSITLQGNVFSIGDFMQVTVTVMDEIGQKTVYIVKGDNTLVDTYVIYD